MKKDNINIKDIYVFAVQTFFTAMLIFPTTFQLERGILLLLLTAGAVLLAIRHWRIKTEVLYLWLATIAVGALGITLGIINSAPGALNVSTIYIFWPMLYMIFIGLSHSMNVILRMQTALLVGISISTLMSLMVMVASIFGYTDIVLSELSFLGAKFGNYEGYIEFDIYSLTTVIYAYPFLFTLQLVRGPEVSSLKKALLWLLIVLIIIVAIGSGRRAFWLVIIMTPFLSYIFLRFSSIKYRQTNIYLNLIIFTFIMIIAYTILAYFADLDFYMLNKIFIDAFMGKEESSGQRYEQASALWKAFLDSPLLGIGLGSSVEVIRSEERPWAYELYFLALLTSVGILGFMVYVIALAWVFVKGMILSKRTVDFAKLFVPQATALVTFLVASATNPYLCKFDYLWVIFLPVATINAFLTQRKRYG